MPSALIDFWRRCKLVAPPFAHPDDLPFLRSSKGRHIDEEPRDFAGFVSGPRFGDFQDTRFHLSLLPSPYAGDLDAAEIVVLLLNPGFSFTDYYAETRVPECRRRLQRTLAQDLKGVEFPFMWLDPEYCWHSGFVWWERKLREIISRIAREKFHNRYLDALRDVSRRLAHLELVPYHSPSFRAHSLIDHLPSAKAARCFVREILAKSGNGHKTFILTRARARWGLPEGSENLVIYEGGLTRGASLGSNSPGGRAILRHYGIQASI
jgi:hypothetical protein